MKTDNLANWLSSIGRKFAMRNAILNDLPRRCFRPLYRVLPGASVQ
jgi:hypothetical protein